MSKYLDENGLLYLWGKIKSLVSNALSNSGFYTKPSGGIPSSDLSSTVQSALNSGSSAYQKPSGGIPETDLASAVQTSLGKADTALQSESDPVFTAHVAHDITSTDISNWNAAEANVVKSVNTTAGTSGINLSLTSGALDVTISSGSIASSNTNFVTGGTVYSTTSLLAPKESPTFTGTPAAPTASAGTNTTQIATTAFVTTAVANGIAGITGISYSVVTTLPASGQAGVIYLVANSGSGTNSYDEYIWLGSSFEKIGTTDVDLSGYLQISAAMSNSDMDTATNNWA